MFVRNCWYVAGWDKDLPPDELIARTIINEPIVLYRTGDGSVVAFADRCCHRLAPLSQGRIEGDDLRCLYHGLKFDRTGRCIEIPGQESIPPSACVTSHPAVEKHSWIWVWMGDPALADAALIPPVIGSDDPSWNLRRGLVNYEANYLLINDNLTDFSHVAYLHRDSFVTSEQYARTRPSITPLAHGLRVQRWLTGPPRSDAEIPIHRRSDGEWWQTYDIVAPGVLGMHTVTCPRGTADRFGRNAPDLGLFTPLAENFTSQAVTPITDRTSRFYFSWGPRAGEGSDPIADDMLTVAYRAFSEDEQMIDGQQKIIDMSPDVAMLNTSLDQGPNLMRSIIDRLLRAEGSKLGPLAAAE